MARRQAAVGEGLQTWVVAVSVLNKQSQTADSFFPPSLELGHGVTPQCKTPACYEK